MKRAKSQSLTNYQLKSTNTLDSLKKTKQQAKRFSTQKKPVLRRLAYYRLNKDKIEKQREIDKSKEDNICDYSLANSTSKKNSNIISTKKFQSLNKNKFNIDNPLGFRSIDNDKITSKAKYRKRKSISKNLPKRSKMPLSEAIFYKKKRSSSAYLFSNDTYSLNLIQEEMPKKNTFSKKKIENNYRISFLKSKEMSRKVSATVLSRNEGDEYIKGNKKTKFTFQNYRFEFQPKKHVKNKRYFLQNNNEKLTQNLEKKVILLKEQKKNQISQQIENELDRCEAEQEELVLKKKKSKNKLDQRNFDNLAPMHEFSNSEDVKSFEYFYNNIFVQREAAMRKKIMDLYHLQKNVLKTQKIETKFSKQKEEQRKKKAEEIKIKILAFQKKCQERKKVYNQMAEGAKNYLRTNGMLNKVWNFISLVDQLDLDNLLLKKNVRDTVFKEEKDTFIQKVIESKIQKIVKIPETAVKLTNSEHSDISHKSSTRRERIQSSKIIKVLRKRSSTRKKRGSLILNRVVKEPKKDFSRIFEKKKPQKIQERILGEPLKIDADIRNFLINIYQIEDKLKSAKEETELELKRAINRQGNQFKGDKDIKILLAAIKSDDELIVKKILKKKPILKEYKDIVTQI